MILSLKPRFTLYDFLHPPDGVEGLRFVLTHDRMDVLFYSDGKTMQAEDIISGQNFGKFTLSRSSQTALIRITMLIESPTVDRTRGREGFGQSPGPRRFSGKDRFRTLENPWKRDTVTFQYVSQ